MNGREQQADDLAECKNLLVGVFPSFIVTAFISVGRRP
jgi:hypothetical protein